MVDSQIIDIIYRKIDSIASKGKDYYIEYSNYFNDCSKSGDYDNLLQCLYINYSIDIDFIKDINVFKRDSWKTVLFYTDSNINKRIKKLYDKNKIYQTGFDIFSSDPNYLTITMSGPLSTTFSSISIPSGISFSHVNNATQSYVNLHIDNDRIYQLDIQNSLWVNNLPTRQRNLQTIIGSTQSNGFLQYSTYRTEISVDHSAQFLVTTYERAKFNEFGKTGSYRIINYKLELSKDNFLGRIIERGTYTDEYKYLIKNKEYARITKTRKIFLEVEKVGATQSVLIEQDNLKLTEENNLYNRYVTAVNLLLP